MSVEASIETALAPAWPEWQGAVINGVYPLRRLLNGSDHSAVFLTECKAREVPDAAVKIIPAERVTLAQLSHWRTAADLSHPHLIQLFDAGLCQLGGRQFLFVVMEYAEQTLSEVLGHRALTPEEVQELLPPTLDALTFLHGKGLVQGHLKPANVLVVDDRLKLASDSVRPASEPRASIAQPSLYDPPEAHHARFSTAGDIWSLGITLVEALTQSLPSRDGQSETTRLPTDVPQRLLDTVQRCLSADPADRPSATQLQAQLAGTPPPPVLSVPATELQGQLTSTPPPPVLSVPATELQGQRTPPPPVLPVPQAVVREAPRPVAPKPESARPPGLMPSIMAAGVLVVVLAVWAGLRFFHTLPSTLQPTAAAAQISSQRPAAAPPASPGPKTHLPGPAVSAASPGAKSRESKQARQAGVPNRPDQPAPLTATVPSLVHAQMPSVPRSALGTIHGRVKVAVLVIVDRSGTVVDALLKDPGPSSYFARLAKEAARKWTFAPADEPDTREWLLRFEFTRSGVTAGAAPGS
jgi:serine/threonine protein kinase